MGKPSNFLRLYVGITWFQPLVRPMKNDRLMTFCYFQAISGIFSAWAGHDIMVMPCSLRRRAMHFCLCSTISLLVQQPNRSGGRAPRLLSPQIPAPLVRSICNCPDSHGGPTGGPYTPGLAPVVHSYLWRLISYLDVKLRKTRNVDIYWPTVTQNI